jgi:hypothetical protein
MRVAETAIAAFGQHEFFAERGEIVDQRFAILVENLRAHRHLEQDRLAIGAMAILAHAVGALLRLEVLLVAIVDQRVQAIDYFDDDIAAAAAIAAAGAAEFDILLAAKRHTAVAAVAGADIDFDEAAGVYRFDPWCGAGMAVCGTRAAIGDAGDRLSRQRVACCLGKPIEGISPGIERSRV